ncbi:hypothetical protein N9J72_00865 [Candidatus Gracilibacteria bacterium]|nr:hypothetical protein [Candidatus Gracilibacteria bacterium]
MALGKIRSKSLSPNTGGTTGEFEIQFANANFGPYTHIFHRENLYFHESEGVRGSYFFPLTDTKFKNTEIFLETNDVAIGIGTRGSFSGQEKQFVEIMSLKYEQKYRFYPDEVSLIYNAQDSIVVYYKKSEKYQKLILDQKTLEETSKTETELQAFFKLLYNYYDESYYRLYFQSNTSSKTNGYFEEQKMHFENQEVPKKFESQKFILEVEYVYGNFIDVWEPSLTGELSYINPQDLG